jgi:hypothetical protein
MAKTSWALKGDYFETCSCDYLWPCIYTRMEAAPTGGECKVSMVFRIREGRYGRTRLDGLSFAVLGHAPGPMAEGNWRVGLVIDERATEPQAEAIQAICSGKVGGPMAMMAPLVGAFAGVLRGHFSIEKKKLSFALEVPGIIAQRAEALESIAAPGKPYYIDNAGHPANKRLALARGSESHLHAFGIHWDDTKGGHNGHFAPFRWASA